MAGVRCGGDLTSPHLTSPHLRALLCSLARYYCYGSPSNGHLPLVIVDAPRRRNYSRLCHYRSALLADAVSQKHLPGRPRWVHPTAVLRGLGKLLTCRGPAQRKGVAAGCRACELAAACMRLQLLAHRRESQGLILLWLVSLGTGEGHAHAGTHTV
jgi:hypothetical protein